MQTLEPGVCKIKESPFESKLIQVTILKNIMHDLWPGLFSTPITNDNNLLLFSCFAIFAGFLQVFTSPVNQPFVTHFDK